MSDFILEGIKIEVTCRCWYCEKSFTTEVKPDGLHSHILQRVYDDTDDGFVLEARIICPICNKSDSLELVRRKGWGM